MTKGIPAEIYLGPRRPKCIADFLKYKINGVLEFVKLLSILPVS